jgi:shikimate dehydrogenase
MTSINARTQLFGVIGKPVGHSLSPIMHNAAMAAMNYPGVFLAFEVEDAGGTAAAVRSLNIQGLSVTIPHKVDIMDHLDEIDPLASKIGAVNTIVNQNGRLIGHNTDCSGAVQALAEQTSIADKKVLLVGAGGAARAVGFGLVEEGAEVIVFNRNPQRGEVLADALHSEYHPISELAQHTGNILVNTTSVGMSPHCEASPVPEQMLEPHMVVMDIVYNPLETAMLKAAKSRGCTIINGTAMFVYQAQQQLVLWTGQRPPVEIMQQAVLRALGHSAKGDE